MSENILDEYYPESQQFVRRRSLIPLWMKIFIWIFMITGGLIIPIFILGVTGYRIELALYGCETDKALSLTGLLLFIVFILKGAVSFSLWFEKKWAVNLGIIDATVGILICVMAMANILISGATHIPSGFRVEILFLIPYLIKLFNIKKYWASSAIG